MINKKILILLVSLISGLSAFGQISQGGTPPSFKYMMTRRTAPSVFEVPVNLDINRLIWEDEMVDNRDSPLRIAEVIPVNINMDSFGNWTTLADSSKIWQQTILAQGAKGLILSYADFYIPEGAKLYIYNEDHSRILGAYTRNTHPEGGKFTTEIISGDKITLEYVASSISGEAPRIQIEGIGYIYGTNNITLRAEPSPPTINRSESCIININCPEGDNWQKQKRGVVLYQVKLGNSWYLCSGSLINNTRRDATPYLLTAYHCFRTNGAVEYGTMVLYFNYEFPGCEKENVFPVTTRTLVGTDLLVKAPIEETTGGITTRGSDGALLRLKESVPLDYKPFYNGWDRRVTAASSGVVIQHPNGDVKKIATYQIPLNSATYKDREYEGAVDASWAVTYNGRSVTQAGSSGSPLFNQNGLIVGSLTGGDTSCSNLLGTDFYGKFSYHWDYLQDETRQMKKYLDPLNEGTFYLKGFDPNNPLDVEEEEDPPKDIVIFPTLADNEVNINTSSIIRNIRVYDMSGRQVYTNSEYNASTTTISIESWAAGVYSVLVHTESKKLTGKFIKK